MLLSTACATGRRGGEDRLILPEFHLPFPAGTRCAVLRANDEGPSHLDEWNRHSFDFALAEGSPVCACADGVVVGARDDTTGPTGRAEDNNGVLLRHADGLISEYLHLSRGGALAAVGEQVLTGDLIGYSGNTGNSTAPHLHFGVRRSTRGPSIPCRFADVPGDGVPRSGTAVESGNVAIRELPGVRRAMDERRIGALLASIDAARGAGNDVRRAIAEAVEAERAATEAGPRHPEADASGIVPLARPDYREAIALFESAFSLSAFSLASGLKVRSAIAAHIDDLRRSR